jgi:RHS repeat-associated protein
MNTKKVFFLIIFALFISFQFSMIAYADDPDTEPPTAPENIQISDKTDTTASISWDASTDNVGVTGYDVYNGETLVTTVTDTSYELENLSPGTEYTIGLVAKDAAGNLSDESTINIYTCLPTPTGISVTAHTTAINILWHSVNAADSYNIKVNDTVIQNITSISYTFRGLTPGQNYSVQIQAVNSETEGVWSAAVSGSTNQNTIVYGTIYQDTTWSVDDSPYDIISLVTITSGKTLTIEPGVLVEAEKSSYYFSIYGNLVANGTTVNPIIFTSKTDPLYGGTGSDFWPGIEIESTGEMDAEHVKIRYAGGPTNWGGSYNHGYSINDYGKLDISDSEITNSNGYGISICSAGIDTTINGCSISNNIMNGINIYTGSSTNIDIENNSITNNSFGDLNIGSYQGGTLTVEGNTISNSNPQVNPISINLTSFSPTNLVGLRGYDKVGISYSTINHDLTLPQNHYILDGSIITIPAGVTLTIEPGTIFRINNSSNAKTFDVSGELIAQGTSEHPIIFTSITDSTYGGAGDTGYWSGIQIESTGVMDAEHITVKYSGGPYSSWSGYSCGNAINDFGNLSITDSEISSSYGCGILLCAIGQSTTIDGCKITNGGEYGININTGAAADIDIEDSTITNNTVGDLVFGCYSGGTLKILGNTITNDNPQVYPISINLYNFHPTNVIGFSGYDRVELSACATITQDITLPQNQYIIDGPYITIPVGVTLTTEPGTIFEIDSNSSGKAFDVSGKLLAEGTSDNPIVFTSMTDPSYGGSTGTDYWSGIVIESTGEFDANYVKIRYSGGSRNFFGLSWTYSINDSGTLNISNSEISYSYGYGIFINTAGQTTAINGCTIINNRLEGICIYTVAPTDITINNNTILSNSCDLDIGTYIGGTLSVEGNTIYNENSGWQNCPISINFSNFYPDTLIGLSGYDNVYLACSSINHDMTLPCNQYVITSSTINIPSGVTLTLVPGTVIKSSNSGSTSTFAVSGKLIASGTADNPIILTSVSDPLYGGSGDTVYWPGIDINSDGEFVADHVTIRNAGAVANYFNGYNYRYAIKDLGKLTLNNSELTNSYYMGIYFQTSIQPTIRDNLFSDNTNAMYNTSNSMTVDAKYNYWNSKRGPSTVSDSTDGDKIIGNITYRPFYGNDLNCATHYGQPGGYGPTGSYSRTDTDLTETNNLMTFTLSRTYNSADNRTDTVFGWGWTFNYEGSISDTYTETTQDDESSNSQNSQRVLNSDEDTNSINTIEEGIKRIPIYNAKSVRASNGAVYVFKKNNDGTFTSTDSRDVSLVKNLDNTYTLTTNDQTRINYNSDGTMHSVSDKYGNTITINYADDKMSSIVDSVGHQFIVTENSKKRITNIEDVAGGRSISYGYDDNGNLTEVDSPNGAVTRYAYDSKNFLTEIHDNDNNLIESVLYNHSKGDDKDKISSITDEFGNTTTYAYDEEDMKVTKTDSNNRQTIQWYDDSLYIVKEQDPEGGIKTKLYDLVNGIDKYGDIASQTDRNGNTTSYVRDDHGNIEVQTNPDGSHRNMTYDDKNNLLSSIDENGKKTYYIYDSTEVYLLKKVQPMNGTDSYDGSNDSAFAITQYTYDSTSAIKGLIKTMTDPEGGVTTYDYDTSGNYENVTNPLGKTTNYSHNSDGWLLSETTPAGFTTAYSYDKNGTQLKKVMDGGQIYRTVHDKENRVLKDIQPKQYVSTDDNISDDTYSGNVGTRYTYYPSGKVHTQTDAEGYMTSYTYDDYGNTETVTNSNGSIYRYEYDKLNRETKEFYRENSSSDEILLEEHSYYILDNHDTKVIDKKYIDSNNYIQEEQIFDYANRLIEKVNADSTTVLTTYNENGTTKQTTDANGKNTYYSYDGLNRLVKKWVPFEQGSSCTMYTYTEYSYDKAGRKTLEKDGKTLVQLNNTPSEFVTCAYEYYADGNLETKVIASCKTTYSYDNDGALSEEKDYYDLTHYNRTEYVNNYLGKPEKKKVHVRKGDISGYSFGSNYDIVLESDYTYDDNGNLQTEKNPNNVITTYGYDNLNRQTSISQPGINEYGVAVTITTSQTYDSMGNVHTKTDANNNVTTYAYDGRNFLIKVNDANGGTALNAYDWLGRVTAKVSPLNYIAGHSISEMNRSEYTYDLMGRQKTMSQVYYDTATSQWVSYVAEACKYDNNGNLVKELDSLGYAAGTGTAVDDKINSGYGKESTYNYANLLISVLDPVCKDESLSFSTKYGYDALSRKISETNANGNVTDYHYDDAGNVTSIGVKAVSTAAEKTTQTKTYDLLGNVLTITDGNGNTTTYEYNALGKIRKVTYPSDSTIAEYTVSSQYDKVGNLRHTLDNNSVENFCTYDKQNRQLSHKEQKSNHTEAITTSTAYDKNGNKRFETDGNGNVTENTYDVLNRLASTTITVSVMNETTSYAYDADNNLLTTTDWLGNVSTNVYDPLNRLIEKHDANNVATEKLAYDNNDKQISSTDALNETTTYTYDKDNRQLTTQDCDGHVSGKTYDPVGNVATQCDALNHVTHFAYDEFNRLLTVTDPLNEVTAFTYDLSGNMLTQTDGNGHTKTYEYNAINKVSRCIDDGGRTGTPGNYTYDPTKTVSYSYCKNGSVYTMTDRNGNVTTYTYDSHNRVLTKAVGSVTVAYTYDGNGNQLTMVDSTGTTTRTYDALNRVLTKTVPVIGTTAYTYDITQGFTAGYSGERSVDPKNNTVLKVTDKVGRLYSVTDGTGTTTYTYYDNGSRESVTYGNGAKEEYYYLEGTLLSELINRRPDNSMMDMYIYDYDAAHNQTSKSEIVNNVEIGETDYTYDTLNRLLTVTEPSGRVTTYNYDAAGNRSSETITAGNDTTLSTYVCDSQDRLTSITERLNGVIQNVDNYAYDYNGNELTDTLFQYVDGIPQAPVVQITNTYDVFNELVQSITGGTTTVNTYNGDGLRVVKSVDSIATRYLYEYDQVVLETDNTGNETAQNVYGTNLLVRVIGNESYQYFYNGHADVTALIDASTGNISATYYYDPFGNIISITGTVSNSIRYAGYQYDDETGFYYLNARMYDPKVARFLQEDTVTGNPNDPLSLNLYTYVRNNPIIYSDPTGHMVYGPVHPDKGDEEDKSSKPKKDSPNTDNNNHNGDVKTLPIESWKDKDGNKHLFITYVYKDGTTISIDWIVSEKPNVFSVPVQAKNNSLNLTVNDIYVNDWSLKTINDVYFTEEINDLKEDIGIGTPRQPTGADYAKLVGTAICPPVAGFIGLCGDAGRFIGRQISFYTGLKQNNPYENAAAAADANYAAGKFGLELGGSIAAGELINGAVAGGLGGTAADGTLGAADAAGDLAASRQALIATLKDVLKTKGGFSDGMPPIIVDENISPKIADGLRLNGYNARSLSEPNLTCFKGGPKDPFIYDYATQIDGRVLTIDRGHDLKGGFFDRALPVKQPIGNSLYDIIRMLETEIRKPR